MKIKGNKFVWVALIGLVLLILISMGSAFAAANIIQSPMAMEDYTTPVTANDLKPTYCYDLDLEYIIVDGNGTSGNDLFLGTAGKDNFNGKNGDDCIVGGGGDDVLRGGQGNDILIGGPGDDDCKDNNGTNQFFECE